MHSFDEITQKFKDATLAEKGNDFVEGLMYNKDEAVIMTGVMTNDCVPEKVMLETLWIIIVCVGIINVCTHYVCVVCNIAAQYDVIFLCLL